MSFFNTHTVTVRRSNPTNGLVLATGKKVQMDARVQDWQMEVQSLIPTHIYDCQANWIDPLLQQSDYLIDEATNIAYSVRSDAFVSLRNQQFQVTRYSGVTP